MIKNRTVQLIYQTIYCTIGIIGFVACFGIFDDFTNFRWDFYVHFTNVSNFFCLGIMFACLIQTIKKSEDSYVSACPTLKFIGILSIVLTFLGFNILLAGAEGRNPQFNWRIGSVSYHIVLPIMYVLHWFLFYQRRQVKWHYPLLSVFFPLTYVILIYLQAIILQFDTSILIPFSNTPLIYPYFFLNIETQGIMVLAWIAAFFVLFVGLGYALFGIDRFFKIKSEDNTKMIEHND